MESQETNTKNTEPQKTSSSIGSFLWDLFKIFFLAFLITAPFRLLVAEPFVVSGSSMYPNFHNRDYLIVDRLTYADWKVGGWQIKTGQEPKRGDIIVFKFPKDTSQYFIKRIIALPGERVALERGGVVIYNSKNPGGFRLEESYLPNNIQTFGTVGANGSLTLGSGEYFVLGDNRTASSDSRVWGILPENDIVGKAFLRVFPLKDFGIIHGANY